MSSDSKQYVECRRFIDVSLTVTDHWLPEDYRNLVEEIEMMKCLGRHRNIVSLIGNCNHPSNVCLVLDYCQYGDLRTYLRNLRLQVS